MPLPPQRAFLRPILEVTAQAEKPLSYKEILAELIPLLSFSDDDLQERTPHGALRVEKHTRYSMHLLKRGGLLNAPSQGPERGRYQITEDGRRYLSDHPDALDPAQLNMLAAEQEPPGDAPILVGTISTAGDISPDEQIMVGSAEQDPPNAQHDPFAQGGPFTRS